MTLLVEDGSGVVGANSYATEDDFDTYTEDHGYTVTVGDTEAALVRATTILDGIYRKSYPGTRTNGRTQYLQWPRTLATDAEGEEIADDEIPQEIIDATCEIALRELASPNSVLPDLERGGSIRSVKAGSVAIQYGDAAPNVTTLQIIDGILGPLIGGSARADGPSSGFVARG